MNRREFLQTIAVIGGSALLVKIVPQVSAQCSTCLPLLLLKKTEPTAVKLKFFGVRK